MIKSYKISIFNKNLLYMPYIIFFFLHLIATWHFLVKVFHNFPAQMSSFKISDFILLNVKWIDWFGNQLLSIFSFLFYAITFKSWMDSYLKKYGRQSFCFHSYTRITPYHHKQFDRLFFLSHDSHIIRRWIFHVIHFDSWNSMWMGSSIIWSMGSFVHRWLQGNNR